MSWSRYQTFQTLVIRDLTGVNTSDSDAMCDDLLIEDGKKVYVLTAHHRNNHCTVLRVCTFINLNMKSSSHHCNFENINKCEESVC